MTRVLVLGGAASGKSAYAESLFETKAQERVYVATAQAFDDEMQAKINAHRVQRGDAWTTIDAPHQLAERLFELRASRPDAAVLVDCATMWLSNRMLADADLEAECTELVAAYRDFEGYLVIVSNEVGQGIVPDNALARRFRNAQGRLNQMLAAESDHVIAVIAGMPLALKGEVL
ncbi:MAG: bifunctional adenosylcobinamide kinase/adenosylcobinamide-phosphate guanylyltransferase [Pseudomonadota bacterium]